MTRAQFAQAIGASDKWVHNAAVALGHSLRYTVTGARRLAVARAIQAAIPVPLRVADRLAHAALADGTDEAPRTVARSSDGGVVVTVDLRRVLSAFAGRLARAMAQTPRRAGRPRATSRRAGARARAEAYGVDLSLIDGNLERTPEERLRALDANAAFVAALRHRGLGAAAGTS